ncbi:hypothetical protein H257_08236 [Aphanomyces astaci]|uniref:Uncharacterized protein n=1 Tax=Aphanomyces astaci TaxID=112090 RepID=W4GG29_APHAT|nr:hypothetical protein H257_08236 [Aphanomyces astaci]ETV78019.1 hypothetical protein H257_08236 [Aphanomyces astaci]|eukprot:XP_009832356.1 hypothetical protein H257_08236 [Aphanomyces astaci]
MPMRRRGTGRKQSVKYARAKRPQCHPISGSLPQSSPIVPSDPAEGSANPTDAEDILLAVNQQQEVKQQQKEQLVSVEQRRVAWVVQYVNVLGSPPQPEWNSHGEYAAASTYLKMKYPGQARFAFGCAIVETTSAKKDAYAAPSFTL